MSDLDSVPEIALPVLDDRTGWAARWQALGQPWRIEPEISLERQRHLAERRLITPDIIQGVYPFKDIALTRADVEWLLATHEDGRGPVDWSDERQRGREGLDLRGADLRRVDLQNLPLACTVADVTWSRYVDLTDEQHFMAAIHLEGADLKGAHLEGARLEFAHLDGADVRNAHLEQATLGRAFFIGAYMASAHLEGAGFYSAHLDEAFLWDAYLQGAVLISTHLEAARLDRVKLADAQGVAARLIDIRWGDVNLGVVDWSQVKMLGDEHIARQSEQDGKIKDNATRLAEYETAVRANRQLAVVLQGQGLNEISTYFAYRAQVLQREVLRRRRKAGQFLFSGFLDILAGYGYKPGRSVVAYLLVIAAFALAYALLGHTVHPVITPLGAVIFSVTSFHGRGFFPGGIPLDDPITVFAAAEAVIGLIIEISFIATFTQRFFGK
ncbi:MAG TPA: pentapeptide repeat-containing protein [Ktedonobacteraceae bacterium]|nr:pentapeptide repeat-containing protein [Ktedonobacteraceae bacterium]